MLAQPAPRPPSSISLLTRIGVIAAATAGLLGGLIACEMYLPLDTKPSIWLRVAGGTLKTARLHAAYGEAAAQADAATQKTARVRAQLAPLQEIHDDASNALIELDQRIRDKQAAEWSVTPRLAP